MSYMCTCAYNTCQSTIVVLYIVYTSCACTYTPHTCVHTTIVHTWSRGYVLVRVRPGAHCLPFIDFSDHDGVRSQAVNH